MKKGLSYIVAFLLIWSGISIFLSAYGDSAYTYEISGYGIVELFSLVYVYSFYSRQEKIKIISIIGCIVGYLITFLSVGNVLNYYSAATYQFGLGFYLYAISSFLFILSLFIKEKKEVSKEEKQILEQTKNKKYILSIYMYGIKNRPELANNKCSLSYNDDKTILNIRIVNKDKLEIIDIPFNFITNINVKPSMTMATTSYSLQEDSDALALISAYMFGAAGGIVNQLIDNSVPTINTKYSTVFITEINYLLNNENEKIVIQTNYPPKDFFEELKDKYEEKQI